MAPPGGLKKSGGPSSLRLNPIGLETRGRFGMQRRLYPSEKPISQNNFMFVGVYPKLNPASAHLAIGGEVQPVSIFNLRATVEVQKYFGTFGFVQSFTSPDLTYSDQALEDLETVPGRDPQAATVFHAALAPLVQMKVGPIAIRSLLQLDYWDFKLRGGDTVAYEATLDTLLPDMARRDRYRHPAWPPGSPGCVTLHPIQAASLCGSDLSAAGSQLGARGVRSRNAHQRLALFAAYTMRDRGHRVQQADGHRDRFLVPRSSLHGDAGRTGRMRRRMTHEPRVPAARGFAFDRIARGSQPGARVLSAAGSSDLIVRSRDRLHPRVATRHPVRGGGDARCRSAAASPVPS
jgi:hypothetical protein